MTSAPFALFQLLAAAGPQASSLPPLEFGGMMYPFAIPILSLAFLMMLGEQFLQVRAGTKADWGRPFVRTAGFIVLLLAYTPFSQGVIAAVKMFGSIDNAASEVASGDGSSSTQGVLAKRATEFAKLRERLDTEAYDARANEGSGNTSFLPSGDDVKIFVEQSILSLVDTALYTMTWFTFTFAAFAIFALKILSASVTKILLEVGPAMIAFAAIPGLTSRYLSAWAMALIEVSAWGLIAKIILGLLINVNSASAGVAVLEDANYAEHIILNFVYAGLFLAVPAITHMILSGSAASVGNTGMAAAVGAMAGAGRRSKAVGSAAVAVGSAGARAAGNAGIEALTPQGGAGGSPGAGGGRGGDAGGGGAGTSAPQAERDPRRDFHAKAGAIAKQRRGD